MQPDRVVIGADDEQAARDPAGPLPAAVPNRAAVPGHRRRDRRADQVRLQRLPRHQDLLHQRDRRALRAARRRRARRRAAAWASTSASAPSSSTPGLGYGGSCFPKDIAARWSRWPAGAGMHLEIVEAVVDRQRGPEAARVRPEGCAKPSAACAGKTIAVLGPGLQAQHRRHPRGPGARVVAPLLADGAQVRAFDPVAMAERRASCCPRASPTARTPTTRPTAPTPGRRHRMERVPPARPRAHPPGGEPGRRRPAQPLRPGADEAAASSTRASGGGRGAGHRLGPRAGRHPARRGAARRRRQGGAVWPATRARPFAYHREAIACPRGACPC